MAWQAAFYMDDFHHILMRPEVTGEEPIALGWKGRFLTFALWRGFYAGLGPSPVAFHAINWCLHGVVALLSFAVLRGFVRLGPERLRDRGDGLALGALLVGMAKEPGFWHAVILLFFLARLPSGAALKREPMTSRQRLGLLVAGGGMVAIVVQAWFGLILDKLGDPEALTPLVDSTPAFHKMASQAIM